MSEMLREAPMDEVKEIEVGKLRVKVIQISDSEMLIIDNAYWAYGWIVFKHPSGDWVTKAEATSKYLLSLISKKEKKIGEIVLENTQLSNEWQECHSYNNEIVAENQKLKKKLEELEAQFNALKELLGEYSIEMTVVKLKARIKSLEEGIEKHKWEKWGYGEDMKEGRFYQVEDELDEELYNLIKGGKE